MASTRQKKKKAEGSKRSVLFEKRAAGNTGDDGTLLLSWGRDDGSVSRGRSCIFKDYRTICASSDAWWERQVFQTRVNVVCWPLSWRQVRVVPHWIKTKSQIQMRGVHRLGRFSVRADTLSILEAVIPSVPGSLVLPPYHHQECCLFLSYVFS